MFVSYLNDPTYDVTLHNELLKKREFLDDPKYITHNFARLGD